MTTHNKQLLMKFLFNVLVMFALVGFFFLIHFAAQNVFAFIAVYSIFAGVFFYERRKRKLAAN